jgi:hypothetical protein
MSRHASKATLDGQRAVNINELIRDGLIKTPGNSWVTTWSDWRGQPVVVLTFTYLGSTADGNWAARLEVVNSSGAMQTVNIVRKRVGVDCSRQHFTCPIPGCHECVDVLYVANFRDHENGLGCRHCLELVYGPRPTRRMLNLRERHGLGSDALGPTVRPKGMHWRTYERLRIRLAKLTGRWIGSVPMLARVNAQIADDLKSLPAALEGVIAALRSLPQQSAENAETTWAKLEAFDTRYHRLMSESQRDRLYAALPPPQPDPPRVEGGTGTQRRYRPPRPASRRRKQPVTSPAHSREP